jgi:phytanoyl-CoA hydroxylase
MRRNAWYSLEISYTEMVVLTTQQSGFELTDEQVECFLIDGFVIVDKIVDPALARLALDRFEMMFAGEFETGLYPDEWHWKPERDDPTLIREICNGWKSDRDVARIVLRADIGKACARLGSWPGARLSRDNVIWKPTGGRALNFHQDAAYDRLAVPAEWVSCWVALEPTNAAGGTLEFVRGSHRWDLRGMVDHHSAPKIPERELSMAAELAGADIEKVPVEVPAGGGVFHAGRTWHGSPVNRGPARRSVIVHCTTSEARFNKREARSLYSRYRRFDSDEMDESFFPILWREDGYRSPFLDPYLAEKTGWGGDYEGQDQPAGSASHEMLATQPLLSAREREVADLVARGLTNRDISRALFISTRTAEGHVERIRNKLSVHSRADIAQWVGVNSNTTSQHKHYTTGNSLNSAG